MGKSLQITEQSLANISKSIDWKYTAGIINTLLKTSFPTLETIEQVVVAFQTAIQYDLDPKMKEMFAWIDNRGNMICIASAMWFMKIARKQKWFIKIESHAIYEWEEFSMDTWTWVVSHKINPSKRINKKPIWAYARLKMEWKEDQVKFVNWTDYYTKKNFSNPWDKQWDALIEKCASTVLLRQAFWLSWLYWEEETDNTRNLTTNVSNEVDKENIENITEELEQKLLNK